MNLAGLRYWQWILIGLVIGSILGWAWSGAPDDSGIRSVAPDEFEANMRLVAADPPRARNVTVYPPETDPSGVAVYKVTYDVFVNAGDKSGFQPRFINAKTPFVVASTRWRGPAPKTYNSILDYLQQSHVPFSNRAGSMRYLPVAYGAVGGVLIVGLLWPTVIQLLVAAGFATPPPPREKKVKMPKSSKITPENDGTIKDGKRTLTGSDVTGLNALNDEMEQRLAAGLSAGSGRTESAAAEEPESIFLSGKGSSGAPAPDTVSVAAAEPDEPKDYKGEWYPVARPHTKRADEPH